MDARNAQREGKDLVHVILEGNRFVSRRLSSTTKLLFWLTNMPYYLLSAHLMTCKPEAIVAAGPPLIHATTVLVIAMVSTAYHGMQVFGEAYNVWEPRLLFADLLAANGYGVVLIILVGVGRVLKFFAIPLLFLFAGARLKRQASPHGFVVGHGVWHILSAAAMWSCLFQAHVGVGQDDR